MSFLTSQPIDLAILASSVARHELGAQVIFAGVVRNHHAGRRVVSLGYTAYAPMAERVCAELVDEVQHRWTVQVALSHRLGELVIGDVAVAIAVSSQHRGPAFDACRWLIDELKARVPIWKHERYADGTAAWVDPTASGGAMASAS